MRPRDRARTSDAPWIRVDADQVTIQLSVRPGASRRGIVRAGPERLVIAIHSAPDKGKANDELIEYLADQLKIPRSAMMILRGATSRHKTIRIVTHESAKVASLLRKFATADTIGGAT